MATRDELTAIVRGQLKETVKRLPPGFDREQTVNLCANAWLIKDPYVHHEVIPDIHLNATADMSSRVAADFHRTLLLHLCLHTLSNTQLQGEMATLQLEEIERIASDCLKKPDNYFELNKQRKPLEKDLSLAAARTLVIGGAWMTEIRRVVLKAAPRGHIARLWRPRFMHALRHLLGGQPECFVIHTLERRIRYFKPAHHETAMRNLAAHLANTSLKGVYRESWFLDPKVADLTPNIEFLSQLPAANGASVFYKREANPGMLSDALNKSPQRKAAYEAGTYQPMVYAYFWPRAAMLNWSGQTPG